MDMAELGQKLQIGPQSFAGTTQGHNASLPKPRLESELKCRVRTEPVILDRNTAKFSNKVRQWGRLLALARLTPSFCWSRALACKGVGAGGSRLGSYPRSGCVLYLSHRHPVIVDAPL